MVYSAKHINSSSLPIDAVVAWVDGGDPAHQQKLNNYLQSIEHRPKMASPTRFNETGEFEYCIVSLLRFAPWLRKIYIVTDSQIPKFWPLLQESPYSGKVEIIDHKTIFSGYESYLPTFSSRTIESVLWRIPDLSERYIYLNDDFIIIRPVQPDDFFIKNKLVVRGKWEKAKGFRWYNVLLSKLWFKKSENDNHINRRPSHKLGQANAAVQMGFRKKYFRAPHCPHPQDRGILEVFFKKNPHIFEKNIEHKLRSGNQFLVSALTTHIAFRQSRVIVNNRLSSIIIKMSRISYLRLKLRLGLANFRKSLAFVCIQNLDLSSSSNRELLINWLNKRVGNLSSFLQQ